MPGIAVVILLQPGPKSSLILFLSVRASVRKMEARRGVPAEEDLMQEVNCKVIGRAWNNTETKSKAGGHTGKQRM